MLQPFLFIGLGGSGGKTLRVVRDEIRSRVEEVGWKRSRSFPSLWQFLHIDVPVVPDGIDPELPSEWPQECYLGLVNPRLTYKTIDQSLIGKAKNSPELLKALAPWRPRVEDVTVPVQKGAGQYRAIGRVITLSKLQTIAERIGTLVNQLQTPKVIKEAEELTSLFKCDSTAETAPSVVVVTSLAGGSGAGALLDVFDVLKALTAQGAPTWVGNPFCVLYAPDVFDAIPPSQRRGVHANALATLSELVAGFWNRRPATPEESAVLATASLGAPISERGPRVAFLVGASNGSVKFDDQNKVYIAAGKALGAWATTPGIQDQIGAYLTANQTSASLGDSLGLKDRDQPHLLSALGFARLSLGRDRFLRYAEERLARLAVERLCRYGDPDDPVVAERVTAHLQRFLAKAGLEASLEADESLINRLRPPDRKQRLQEVRSGVLEAARKNVEGGRAASWWRNTIVQRFGEKAGAFGDGEAAELHRRAREWVGELPRNLARVTSEVIAQEGLVVTERLLRAAREAVNGGISALPAEIQRYTYHARQVSESVGKALSGPGDAVIGGEHHALADAAREGASALEWKAEADLLRLVEDLLRDASRNLLEPLESAVREARKAALQVGVDKGSAHWAWPKGDELPVRFLPSPTEHILTAPEEFPTLFREQMRATFPNEAPESAVTHALVDAFTDRSDDGQEMFVRVEKSWIPERQDLQLLDAPSKGSFALNWQLEAVFDRMRKWCNVPGSAFAEYGTEDLARYLDDEQPDKALLAQRQSQFRGALKAALRAAEPLARIDTGVVAQISDDEIRPARPIFSPIPFSIGSAARDIVIEVLKEQDKWHPELDKSFSEVKVDRIDIMTTLSAVAPPIVFGSITSPILGDWAKEKETSDGIAHFWRWRRTRPLPASLPMSPSVLEAMVRGWFVAQFLGRLRVSDVDTGSPTVSLFVQLEGEKTGWCHYVKLAMGRPAYQNFEVLPAVLESFPIALLEFASGSEIGRQAQWAFTQLRVLGEDGEENYSYEVPSKPLRQWLENGSIPPGAPIPNHLDGGTQDDAPEQRVKLAQAFFQVRHENYRQLFESEEPRSEELSRAPARAWELRREILKALEDLSRAVSQLQSRLQSPGPTGF